MNHIDPRRAGEKKIITNMVPLCGDSNQRKGGQKITLRQLWRRVEDEGLLMTASQDDLPGLAEMLALATERHGTMITKKGLL